MFQGEVLPYHVSRFTKKHSILSVVLALGCSRGRLVPEPENQYDSEAIAFHCKVVDKWNTIEYVREAHGHVHAFMPDNRICSVQEKWTRSGPGFFAGINITANGEWPLVVCQCALGPDENGKRGRQPLN